MIVYLGNYPTIDQYNGFIGLTYELVGREIKAVITGGKINSK